jgi:hypothetical protein
MAIKSSGQLSFTEIVAEFSDTAPHSMSEFYRGGEDGYFVKKSDFGVIAQDVQEVFPQAVRTRNDGTLAVDYEKLATLSFGAIKELVKRVEALESK